MITLFGGPEREQDVEETREIDLSGLQPKIARPFSPANVCDVAQVTGLPITQAVVGSCTNGRENDMEITAKVLKNNSVHPDVNMLVVPASKTFWIPWKKTAGQRSSGKPGRQCLILVAAPVSARMRAL